jgi:hypothetical protein
MAGLVGFAVVYGNGDVNVSFTPVANSHSRLIVDLQIVGHIGPHPTQSYGSAPAYSLIGRHRTNLNQSGLPVVAVGARSFRSEAVMGLL